MPNAAQLVTQKKSPGANFSSSLQSKNKLNAKVTPAPSGAADARKGQQQRNGGKEHGPTRKDQIPTRGDNKKSNEAVSGHSEKAPDADPPEATDLWVATKLADTGEENRRAMSSKRAELMKQPAVRFAFESLVEQIIDTGQPFFDVLMSVDASGDGTLDKSELNAGLMGIGVNLTEEELDTVFEVCDEDGGGDVDMNEFIKVVSDFRNEMREIGQKERIKRWLKKLITEKMNPFVKKRRKAKKPKKPKKRTFMLSAQGMPRILWDLTTMICLLYLIVSMPLRMGFELDPEGFGLWLERLIDAFFICDIVVNFRSYYLDETGREITDQKQCALNYLRGWFTIDFLSSIPFDWFLSGLGSTKAIKSAKLSKAVKVVRLLKLSKLMKSSAYAHALEDWFAMNRFGLQLVKMLVTAFSLAHFMSCFWAFMGNLADPETEPEQAWFNSYTHGGFDWEQSTTGEQYLLALYWSITTVTTVGYGDVLPASNYERMYVIGAMLVGGAFYGLVIANMNSIVTNMDTNSRMYNERMDAVCSYLSERKFPPSLAFRVRKYFKHLLLHKTALDEQVILEKLSPQLRQEVSRFLIDDLVLQQPLFKGLSDLALTVLLQILTPLEFSEGTLICRVGEKSQDAYISRQGIMTLLTLEGKAIRRLKPGDMFGELSLLDVQAERECSLLASSDVECYSIAREELIAGFTNMPEQMDIMIENALGRALKRDDPVLNADPFKKQAFQHQLAEVRHRRRKGDLWRGVSALDDLLGVSDYSNEKLEEMFQSIDDDANGYIERQELENFLQAMGKDELTIRQVMYGMKQDKIGLSDFLLLMRQGSGGDGLEAVLTNEERQEIKARQEARKRSMTVKAAAVSQFHQGIKKEGPEGEHTGSSTAPLAATAARLQHSIRGASRYIENLPFAGSAELSRSETVHEEQEPQSGGLKILKPQYMTPDVSWGADPWSPEPPGRSRVGVADVDSISAQVRLLTTEVSGVQALVGELATKKDVLLLRKQMQQVQKQQLAQLQILQQLMRQVGGKQDIPVARIKADENDATKLTFEFSS
jgi:Ca2+-binding EF-hand superfamily protein/CRP-like cAMP-binding protein